MARIETDPNYTAPTFSRATAATDLFKKEDVQGVAAALSTHDHTSGKGLILPAAAIPTGLITSAMIADLTIQTGDIADSQITTAKIADGQITAAKMAADSVGTAAIIDGSIGSLELGPNAVHNSLTTNALSAFSTTSGTMVPTNTSQQYNASAGMVGLLALAQINWNNNTVNTANTFAVYWDATSYTGGAASYYVTVVAASFGQMAFLYSFLPTPSVGTHTAQVYMGCNGGTLTIPGSASSITVIGFNR